MAVELAGGGVDDADVEVVDEEQDAGSSEGQGAVGALVARKVRTSTSRPSARRTWVKSACQHSLGWSVGLAIRELHRSENDLAHELLQVSDRHKSDHEVFHVARDLARWSQNHVRDLSSIAGNYGVDLDPEPEGEMSLAEKARQKAAELVGRRAEPSLLLLRDLRELHMKAAGVSLDWELLGQAAQGARQIGLLELTERCHPESLRQMRWANAKLKTAATQALLS